MKPALLIETTRNRVIEKQHYGFIIVVDREENILLKTGDDENKNFCLRSVAKPFQAAVIVKTGTFDRFNFTLQELAVCCASHAGTEEHIRLVKSVLDKIGLKEENLQCGIHDPLDKAAKEFLIRNNLSATQLHNNCSGKHAGMLAVCVAKGWNIQNYLDFDHPVQKLITETIAEFCNFDENKIDMGRDGCSAPVHALPHYKMGVGFLNLFLNNKYENIKRAFQKTPFLIGGDGRLDTEIIRASSGRLISKVGAGGLCITVNTEEEKALIVKIVDADMPARAVATIEALKQLKWLSEEEIKNNNIKTLFDLKIKTLKNKTAGKIIPKFILL